MALRALIAEDERLIALALRSRLESQGYQVVGIAGSGTQVLDLFAVCSPNIVLMDVRMPAMDGIEATRALMLENPACVVIVSGNRDPAQIERAERAGAMDYVVKPFEAQQMRPVLGRAQGRFDRFMAIRSQLGDPHQALETWLAVRRAVRALTETGCISEDEAHQQLERRAAEQGVSLQAAADDIVRPGASA
jgi:response regulator NasT